MTRQVARNMTCRHHRCPRPFVATTRLDALRRRRPGLGVAEGDLAQEPGGLVAEGVRPDRADLGGPAALDERLVVEPVGHPTDGRLGATMPGIPARHELASGSD